ncbi:MAG: FAD-dependent monooxygenase [Methyloligellaceae bacterium]
MGAERSTDPLLVAGGGIGGLSVAIALARQGQSVRLLERAETFSEAGAGIQLGPNATRILQGWNVLDRLRDDLVAPEGVSIFDGLSGVRLAMVPLGAAAEERYGSPYIVVHRADLQRGLLETARTYPEIVITTGFALTRYVSTAEGVSAHATTGDVARGRALIAADGVASRVRKQLNPDAALRFSGRTAWRTLLEPAAVPSLGRGHRTGLWLAPNAHLVHYAVRGGRAINIVAVVEDRWNQEGWNTEADASELLPHYAAWAAPVREALQAATAWRKWALFELPPLASWWSDNVVLLGDAAHPTLPFLAQGGAMAIEDAAILACELSREGTTPDEAFRRYASLRRERTLRVQTASRQNGRLYHLSGPARLARNLALRFRSPEALLGRFDWLYRFEPEAP